jgi:hypothetical protein
MDWYQVPIWGWILICLPIMGIMALCMALTAWKIMTIITNRRSGGNTLENQQENNNSRRGGSKKVLCPLCVLKVSDQSWKSGRHRKKCARKYALKMSNEWPIFDPNVVCPVCNEILRQMPSIRRLYHCHACPSPSIRIGCFVCDFTLCENCGEQQRIGQNLAQCEQNFVPPKTSPLDLEPSAPDYDLVVTNQVNPYMATADQEEYLPSYEEAILNIS